MPCIYTQARLAQLVERKALNLVVVGSSPTVGGFLQQRRKLTFDGFKHFSKMDLSGFEPEAFCMQSRRDTTTPQAPVGFERTPCRASA